jgi:hypothetical protein
MVKKDRNGRRRLVGGEDSRRLVDSNGIRQGFVVGKIFEAKGLNESIKILRSPKRKASKQDGPGLKGLLQEEAPFFDDPCFYRFPRHGRVRALIGDRKNAPLEVPLSRDLDSLDGTVADHHRSISITIYSYIG